MVAVPDRCQLSMFLLTDTCSVQVSLAFKFMHSLKLYVQQLYFDQGASPQPHYELCAHAVGVKLPATGYFGLSAATGGLAG